MAEETAKKETETISRVIYFDETDKSKWREWKLKTFTIGHVKNWKKAFLHAKEEKITEDIAKINVNNTAWTYLIHHGMHQE
jgi:hypothetical protein